jgi:hypothetical protein
MGWPAPKGKLLPYERSAAKQALRTYTLDDKEVRLDLHLLDTLDCALKWDNSSANIRPEPNHQGVARLPVGEID